MLDIRGVEDLQEIGRGGTSVVYSGVQANFGRSVAVKVFDLTLQRDNDRERFRRECRAIGSLSGHPNIVTVFDEGVLADGRPYLVMEYLPTTLADELAQRGTFTWQQACELGITMAGALGAAHRSGILHRDVKPENVLLTSHGVPKLTDFGLAQVAGGFQSRTSTVRASLSHASPEMIEGAPVSTGSDVYSLASTIHHLISGKPPFVHGSNDSLVTIVSRIVRDDPPSLAPFDVPEGLQGLLRQAMSKDPAARPQDVATFSAALEDELGERPGRAGYVITNPVRVTTVPVAAAAAVRAPVNSRRRQTFVVVAFAALLGAVGAAIFVGNDDKTAGTTTSGPSSVSVSSTPTSSTSSTVAATTTVAVPTEPLSALLARDYPQFSSLLQTAGLLTVLEGTDPYTVFALPDAAFANVSADSMALLGSDPNLLFQVLAYHVTTGALASAQLVPGDLSMLSGVVAPLSLVEGGGTRIGGANIAQAEVLATNGVIHPIDTLLVPPGANLTVATIAPTTTTTPRATTTTVRPNGTNTTATGTQTTAPAQVTTTPTTVQVVVPATAAPTTAAPTTAAPTTAPGQFRITGISPSSYSISAQANESFTMTISWVNAPPGGEYICPGRSERSVPKDGGGFPLAYIAAAGCTPISGSGSAQVTMNVGANFAGQATYNIFDSEGRASGQFTFTINVS